MLSSNNYLILNTLFIFKRVICQANSFWNESYFEIHSYNSRRSTQLLRVFEKIKFLIFEVHERDIDTEFILLILKKLKKNKLLSLPKVKT